MTTFGTAGHAQQAVDAVRAVHERVRGTTPDGEPYRASDPHLLLWVHVAEVDSFLRAHQRFGARRLDAAGCDACVADTAVVAEALGVRDAPRSRAELAERLAGYRGELRATAQAREAARFLLVHPPLPALARPPYAVPAANAVSMLPPWARPLLGLPHGLPRLERLCVRPTGQALTAGIRWAMAGPPPARQPRQG